MIIDRDTIFSPRFKSILRGSDVEIMLTAYQAPNMNAHAERFVRSIKSECLDRMIFLGRESLDRAMAEYAAHYMKSGATRESETSSSTARRRSGRVSWAPASGWVACSSTITGGRREKGRPIEISDSTGAILDGDVLPSFRDGQVKLGSWSNVVVQGSGSWSVVGVEGRGLRLGRPSPPEDALRPPNARNVSIIASTMRSF